MEEEYRLWKGKYKVYKNGDVFAPDGRKLNPYLTSHGYLMLTPYINGKRYNKRVHQMVAEVWLPNPDNHPMINHINGEKTDNRVENLEWCSASHNQLHAYRTGLKQLPPSTRKVVFCETGQVFPSPKKCVEQMGWGDLASAITCCCKRSDSSKTKRRKIKGYTVRYYQPTPLVEKLLQSGYDKYPESYDRDVYYCYLCLAQKWLREVKEIDVLIFNCACGYGWEISKAAPKSRGTLLVFYDDDGDDEASGMRLTYEKALSAGINRALQFIKNGE